MLAGATMTITFRELDRTADRRGVEAIDTTFETETVFDLVTTPRRIELVERPLEKPLAKRYSIAEVFAGWARWDTGWVADDGGIRGFAAVEHEPWHARLVLWFLYIEPAWRRRGIGSRLLAAVRESAVGPRLLTDADAGSPGEAFCRRHGFRHTESRRHHLLTYCDIHEAWLGELIDAAHPGYRLAHWSGDLSDVSQVETLLRTPSRPGNALLTVAEADGDLAAYAMAVVCAPPQPRARQYGPAVSPEHRGRRLDHWVNAALIQRLRQTHPHVNEIQTHTAENDPGLLAARAELGFRPVRRTHLYELSLS